MMRLACFALLASLCLLRPAEAADPIVIGVVLPMTGIYAAYGKPYSDGLQVAVDETNKAGGIDGRPLKLVIEDAQASNTIAINALNKVLLEKPAAVFIPGIGPAVLAMLPTIEKSKVPTLASASSAILTEKGAKYFFRATSSDVIDKEDEARFLVDKLGKKKIGLLYVDSEWGYSLRDNLAANLKKLYNLTPAAEASYQPTDKDFTAVLAQMSNAGVDAIVTQGYAVDEALIVKQMNQMGMKVPHIGGGALCNAYSLHLVATTDLVGQYCAGPALLPEFDPRPRVHAFAEAYKAIAGTYPNVYVEGDYDALSMIVAIIRKVGTDPEKIRDGLATMEFDGIAGTYKADATNNLWTKDLIAEFLPDGTMKAAYEFQQK